MVRFEKHKNGQRSAIVALLHCGFRFPRDHEHASTTTNFSNSKPALEVRNLAVQFFVIQCCSNPHNRSVVKKLFMYSILIISIPLVTYFFVLYQVAPRMLYLAIALSYLRSFC